MIILISRGGLERFGNIINISPSSNPKGEVICEDKFKQLCEIKSTQFHQNQIENTSLVLPMDASLASGSK